MKQPRILSITGVAGKAERATVKEGPAIAAWLLTVEGFHAFWRHWGLSVANLQDMPNVPPANKHYPQAEYELLVVALDPAVPATAESTDSWKPLLPVNVVVQFHGVTPGEAATIAEQLARDVAQGRLIPEPQGIQGARDMWKDAVSRYVTNARNEASQRSIDAAVSEMKGENQE